MKIILFMVGMIVSLSTWAMDPAKIVVGYGPGGTNTIIRTLAADAENHAGQKFRVENKPGANGSISVKEYLRETPSNQSMLGVTGGQILFEALVNPENNFIKQLKFIGPVLTSPLSLAVNSNSDIKSIADLFDRSIPRRRINIAVGGESHQMLVNLIAQHSHHDVQGIRFKGGVDGYTALRGGHVDAQVDVYGWFTQYLPDIRIVAVAQEQSMKYAPSIHQWVPSATLVNFFAIAINRDTKDTRSIEQAFADGMYRSNRNLYWEQQGYNIDRNSRADYVERILVPTYTRWKSQLSNTKKPQL